MNLINRVGGDCRSIRTQPLLKGTVVSLEKKRNKKERFAREKALRGFSYRSMGGRKKYGIRRGRGKEGGGNEQ